MFVHGFCSDHPCTVRIGRFVICVYRLNVCYEVKCAAEPFVLSMWDPGVTMAVFEWRDSSGS